MHTRRLTHGLFSLALMFLLVPIAQAQGEGAAAMLGGPSQALTGGRISLQVGKSTILQDVQSYEVSNSSVVEAEPTDDGRLILHGRSPGSSSLIIVKSNMLGVIMYEVSVTGVDVENALKTVKAALGGIVGLQITQEGNVVVLQGDVVKREDGVRIDRQLDMFGTAILDLTNRAYLEASLNLFRQELAASPFSNIVTDTRLNREGMEVLTMRGTVLSQQQKDQLMAMASRYFDPDRISEQVMIDAPQVEIDIEVYSFDIGRLRSLGNNTLLRQLSTISANGWTFQTGPRLPITGVEDQAGLDALDITKHTLSYPAAAIAPSVSQFLDAVNEIDTGAAISKQHAAVRSGQPALVKNITEENILIPAAFDATLEQVTYGQELEITPALVDNDRFETLIRIELSNPVGASSSESAITIGRRTYTSSFISGQRETIILGGNRLITSFNSEESTPFLAHIPIVNWWFKDKFNNHADTVQVFLMTLFAPASYGAQEAPQSQDAPAIKAKTMDRADDDQEFLQKRHRWEAEGVKTLFTGESRFD
jgi:Flp pilus assembly secretin CpaC